MSQFRRQGLLGRKCAAGVALLVVAIGAAATAQPLAQPANGPRRADPTWHALRNATVHTRPGETIPHGTVLIRDGVIQAVLPGQPGADGKAGTDDDVPAPVPMGPRVWDLTGHHIYAGFIDAYVEVDAPRPDMDSPGTHWSPRVTPQRRATDGEGLDKKSAESLRKLGFTAAAIAPKGGIFRGRSAVISLAAPMDDLSQSRPPVYRADAYQSVAFDLSDIPVTGKNASKAPEDHWPNYPDSQMGAIALIRQTMIDAEWQAGARAAGAILPPNALDALISSSLPPPQASGTGVPPVSPPSTSSLFLFNTEDELEALRAAKIAKEFGDPAKGIVRRDDLDLLILNWIPKHLKCEAILLGSGLEFRRLDAITADGLPIVLPLNFPETPDVSTPAKAESVELRELMTWEQAPTNPRRLDAAGMKIALTTAKLESKSEFAANLARAIRFGLTPERALAMLTTTPAELLGVQDRLGTVESGKLANLIVASGELFQAEKPPKKKEKLEGKKNSKEENKAGEPEKKREGDPEKKEIGKDEGRKEEPPGESKKEEPANDDDDETNGKSKRDSKKDEPEIRDLWIDGIRHEINPMPGVKLDGVWTLIFDPPKAGALTLEIDTGGSITIKTGDAYVTAEKFTLTGSRFGFVYDATDLEGEFAAKGVVIVNAIAEKNTAGGISLFGEAINPDSSRVKWTARRSADDPDEAGRPAAEKAGNGERDGTPRLARPFPRDAMTGQYLMVSVDDKPEALEGDQAAFIVVNADGTVVLKGKGGLTLTPTDVKLGPDTIEYAVDSTPAGGNGIVRVKGRRFNDHIIGTLVPPNGNTYVWNAARVGMPGEEIVKDAAYDDVVRIASMPEKIAYPFGPYSMPEVPAQGTVVVHNATIWTCGPAGVLKHGTMVVQNGNIVSVGGGTPDDKGASGSFDVRIPLDSRAGGPPVVIDAAGKHLTPGIIDCHSHTGISKGVNEGGQAVTAEVRIQDVTNPDSINWYRQLAGGVTSVNSLHGSANVIGGQNAVNKIRWGVTHPDQMHLEGAKPGIKFALGENPKASNWGDRATTRYPQTRMGVEALIRDRFVAAREYREARQRGSETARQGGSAKASTVSESTASSSAPDSLSRSIAASLPLHRDLELDALAEILSGERLVHCHSYRQDEILMLCRLAKEFGFTIGTFQHCLEGYKVADEIKAQAIGASLFSDWWAYKVEVQDAIPHAGPIMTEVGVPVSYNSDSDEMARRLNTEAAKAVRYGDLKPEEALKYVTINPAKQLMIDSHVGSLEVGKDADFVIWSGPPLSVTSKCEATYIDGREYFSLVSDAKHRERHASERARLIQKALAAPPGGGKSRGKGGEGEPASDVANSTTLAPFQLLNDEQLRRHYLDLYNRGINPLSNRPGVCGCGMIHER